jgi:hypothetical protein
MNDLLATVATHSLPPYRNLPLSPGLNYIHRDSLSVELFNELFDYHWMIVQHGLGYIVVMRQRGRLPLHQSRILLLLARILTSKLSTSNI